jgi:hypothetical protein
MKDRTGDSSLPGRAPRVLVHRRAIVERVLPMGAPPLHDDVAIRHDPPAKRRRADASLLDRLGPTGRVAASDDDGGDRVTFGEERDRRRQLERSSWMRYLMNVHLMWVD